MSVIKAKEIAWLVQFVVYSRDIEREEGLQECDSCFCPPAC
jgi:hypothetical protein